MHRAVGRSTRRERKAVTFPSLSLSPSQEKVGVNGRVRKGEGGECALGEGVGERGGGGGGDDLVLRRGR